MKYCPYCRNELQDEEMVCPQCGFQYNQEMPNGVQQQPKYNVNLGEDNVSVWLVILSFLIPLVGFIYWGVKKNDRPKCAKACGIAGIIGFVVNMFLMM